MFILFCVCCNTGNILYNIKPKFFRFEIKECENNIIRLLFYSHSNRINPSSICYNNFKHF